MSSDGRVKFLDGTIMYFEYDSVSDICIPKLYNTFEEMDDNWGRWKWEEPECDHKEEPVEIYTSYGGGFSWNGTACRKCMMILDGRNPYNLTDEDENKDLFLNDFLGKY